MSNIIFNPDPKLQAEAMRKAFYSPIFDIDNGVNVSQDQTRYDAAKSCALLAAEIGKSSTTEGPGHYSDSEYPQVYEEYWSAVIEELNKL